MSPDVPWILSPFFLAVLEFSAWKQPAISKLSSNLVESLLTLSGHLEVIDAFLCKICGAFHRLFAISGRSAVVLLAQWLRHRA